MGYMLNLNSLPNNKTGPHLRRTTIKISITIVLFSLFCFHPAQSEEQPFIVADDLDATPYIFANSGNEPDGIFHDIITNAFRRMKTPLQYDVYPWTRAQMIVNTKQADALITVPTPKRLEHLLPSQEPVFVMQYKIFTQSDNPNIDKIKAVTSLSDLKEFKIIDYIGDGWAEKNLKQYGVEWSPNLTSACKMLAAHRGDIFLQDEVMVLYALKNIRKTEGDLNHTYDKIIAIDAPVKEIKFHLLIRKDSEYIHVLPNFDATLRAMHHDGEFAQIQNKWIQ